MSRSQDMLSLLSPRPSPGLNWLVGRETGSAVQPSRKLGTASTPCTADVLGSSANEVFSTWPEIAPTRHASWIDPEQTQRSQTRRASWQRPHEVNGRARRSIGETTIGNGPM